MLAAGVKRVPAGALRVLAVTFEIGLAVILVDEFVLARHIMDIELGFADDFLRIVELPWLRKMGDVAGVDHEGGLTGRPFTLSIASFKVPSASGLAGLLKPTWLSEICRKLKPVAAFSVACAVPMPRSCEDFGTPPLSVQITPVPAQIMHSSAPRRSIPVPCLLSDMFSSPFTAVLRRCYRGDLPAGLFIPAASRISRGSVQVFMA